MVYIHMRLKKKNLLRHESCLGKCVNTYKKIALYVNSVLSIISTLSSINYFYSVLVPINFGRVLS